MPSGDIAKKCVNCGDVVGDKPHYVEQEPGQVTWTCKRSPEREAKLRKVHPTECRLQRCENCHEYMVLSTGLCMQCGHTQGKIGSP